MRRHVALVATLLGLAGACTPKGADDANVARGRGLKPAALGTEGEASVLDAAAHASFDFGPGLVLMLHPRRLPRTEGMEGGDTVPAPLVAALRTRGTVHGTCEPQRDAPRNTPRCAVPQAGYLIRTTEPLRVAGDTVEVYFAVERFGAATGQRPEAMRFEKIYQLTGSGTAWRVVREARVKSD